MYIYSLVSLIYEVSSIILAGGVEYLTSSFSISFSKYETKRLKLVFRVFIYYGEKCITISIVSFTLIKIKLHLRDVKIGSPLVSNIKDSASLKCSS